MFAGVYWYLRMSLDFSPGAVIGARYRMERFLGEGGMGVVWAAEDIAAGRRCAVKLMKDPDGDPDARKRFLREGRAASAVRHPNVVRILDVLDLEAEPAAIAMELLEGESLRAMLGHERKLSLGELAEIMVPVVSAVGTAHALGIVHRDLKPENIFLARGADGERAVKVLDFGIAKLTALDGEAMRSTGIMTGAILGTPAYMAPEQVFAENDLDHRADIWALGIIFYECLAGVCPTQGDNVGQVLKHVVARPFEPLSELVPELPETISRLVARMLARDRSQRPLDLHEVLESLAPFASRPGESFGAPMVRFGIAGDPAAAAEIDPLAATMREVAPRPRRGRLRVLLGSAVAVALLAAGVARPHRPAPVPASPPDAARLPSTSPDAQALEKIVLEGEENYRLGNHARAIELFKQAFALDTEDSHKAMYLFNIAQSYRFSNDCRNAHFFFLGFQALSKNDPRHTKSRAKIEELIKKVEECMRQQEGKQEQGSDTKAAPDGGP